MSDYPKIPETDYQKAKGQLRLQLHGVFEPFNCYGLQAYIPEAVEQAVYLCEQFGKRIRGKDVPIRLRRQEWIQRNNI